MRKPAHRHTMQPELALAIGLVWGHLRADQYEEALHLAQGCLRVWPKEERLAIMAAYAAAELLEPFSESMLSALRKSDCKEWMELVMLRANGGIAGSKVVN